MLWNARSWLLRYACFVQIIGLFLFRNVNNVELRLYVCLVQVTELPFFASKVRLGRNGMEEVYGLGPLNEYERYAKMRSC